MSKGNKLTVVLLAIISVFAVIFVVISLTYPDFVFELQPGSETPYTPGGTIYEIIYILLTVSTDILYLVGGGIVFFGGILVTVRFLRGNPEDPHKAHEITRHLSGYLTLGLAFFIGAEIIKTVVVRTPEEFYLLILTIVSRGLFSLILYLERRWHGSETG